MGSEKRHHLQYLFTLYLPVIITTAVSAPVNGSVPALFVFGDSYVDTGNNGYIATFGRSNFPPYGIDFIDHKPTGRWSNERIISDYFVSYLGIKQLLPPYLEPNLSIKELKSGVSFASAGSGFDPLTNKVANIIVVEKQADLFKKSKTKLEVAIGKKATEVIVAHAVYLVNAGTNDIANNYFRSQLRSQQFTIQQYIQFLINRFREFVQILVGEGGRRFAVAGVPPLGCTPTVISRFSEKNKTDRRCIEKVQAASRLFNQVLQDELKLLQTKYEDDSAKFTYLDQYQALNNFIRSPNLYGFDDVNVGCCTNKVGLCLPRGSSTVCPDRTKYVFWDFIHLTDKAASLVVDSYGPNIEYLITSN